MNEDATTVAALQEIAALLRRRMEQEDEAVERAAQREARLASDSDFAKLREDRKQTMDDLRLQTEKRSLEQKREKEQTESETRAFREKLLAEFARHNELLERIAAQMEK